MATSKSVSQTVLEDFKGEKTKRDIIFTGIGSESATKAAYRGGAMIGFEATRCRPPEQFSAEFVDWPFKKIEEDDSLRACDLIDDYIQVVKEERPKYAVVPDINDDVTAEQAFNWAYEIEDYCDNLILAPKEIHPTAVPDDIRVGIPCQDKFSEIKWTTEDFKECNELHLFGGSPHTHYELVYGEGLRNVESIDTSVPLSSAQWGDSWILNDDGDPYWKETRGGTYGCIEYSYYTMNRVFNRDRPYTPTKRRWVERPDWGSYETCGYPDEDLVHPAEEEPFPGREYYTEMSYNKF